MLKTRIFCWSVLHQDVQHLCIEIMSCTQVFSQQLAALKSLHQLLNRKQNGLCIEGWWLQYWILRPCLSNNFLQRQAKIFASENWKKLKEAQRDAFKTKAMTKWKKGLILDQEHFVHWIPVVLLPVYVPVYLVFYCTSIVNYNPLGRVQSGK